MPRSVSRSSRRKRVVRTVPRKGNPSASGRDSFGRGFAALEKHLREQAGNGGR